MIDTVQEKFEDLRDRLPGTGDAPDGENAGISQTESVIAYATAAGAAFLTRQVLMAGWRRTLDREPPKNPASHEVDWKDALMWGALSGALVGVARIASRRMSTDVYRSVKS